MLFDFTESVFADTQLPTSFDLADFQTRVAGLLFCCQAAGSAQVTAQIDAFNAVTAVAEPTSLSLVLACLGLFGWLSRPGTPRRAAGT